MGFHPPRVYNLFKELFISIKLYYQSTNNPCGDIEKIKMRKRKKQSMQPNEVTSSDDLLLFTDVDPLALPTIRHFKQPGLRRKPRKKRKAKAFDGKSSSNSNVCPRCGKRYNYRKNLTRHMNNECQIEPRYGCSLCSYRAYYKFVVRKHAARWHKNATIIATVTTY